MNRMSSLILATLLVAPAVINAKSSAPELLSETELNKVQPVKRVEPKYPLQAARRGQDGWVEMSFDIDEQGNVIDAFVIDSVGGDDFEQSALAALTKWQYEPPMADGKPTKRFNNTIKLDYNISRGGISRTFNFILKDGIKAINSNDPKLMAEVIEKLDGKKNLNATEYTWFKYLQSFHYAMSNQASKRYQALLHIPTRVNKVPEEYIIYAMQERFVYEVQNFLYDKALLTIESIEKLESEQAKQLAQRFSPYAAKIKEQIASQGLIVVNGSLNEKDSWFHTPVRHSYSISNISGNLSELIIRCDHKKQVYRAEANVKWDVPASWGRCSVKVTGDKGATFKFNEMPSA